MISIAMCTYNGSEYLSEQLSSIMHQTIPPDEIIICDDGSSDGSVEVARDVLNEWTGISSVIINERNLGFTKNFEKAISLCHGDIIFLSDQDDVWEEDKVQTMMSALTEHPEAVMAFHDSELVDSNLNHLYSSFWKDSLQFDPLNFFNHDYKHLYKNNVVQGSACAFRRCVFEKATPFPVGSCHDEWLALVALTMGEIYPVPEALMKYRQSNNIIGGLPVDMSSTFNNVFKRTKLQAQVDNEEHMRRLGVLNAFLERFPGSEERYKLDIRGYATFLSMRSDSIQNKRLRPSLMKYYKKYYFRYRRHMFKDVCEVLFG